MAPTYSPSWNTLTIVRRGGLTSLFGMGKTKKPLIAERLLIEYGNYRIIIPIFRDSQLEYQYHRPPRRINFFVRDGVK
jgi:hypothetical protein